MTVPIKSSGQTAGGGSSAAGVESTAAGGGGTGYRAGCTGCIG